jgi:Fe-S cluster assembly iron-binding protein IscA
MLTVTEKAQEKIAAFFEGKDPSPIRVFLSNGCGGPRITLGLDEATAQDNIFEFADFQYVVEKNLLAQAHPIIIDFTDQGFKVSSSLEPGPTCGGCGSSTGCY